ncbi:hypothetical protein V8B97DRAFT_583860 [Scleroderma yunnanense]
MWLRVASSAEVFWSARQPGGSPLNVRGTSASPYKSHPSAPICTHTSHACRGQDIQHRMVQRGIRAIPLQPEWCALRPLACNLDA